MSKKIILTINCGSSSIKFMLYQWERKRVLASGIVERIGLSGSMIKYHVEGQDSETLVQECPHHEAGIKLILKVLISGRKPALKNIHEVSAVGHRVVHGGEKFNSSVLIDGEHGDVLEELKAISPLAPLHNPVNIMGIEAALKALPEVAHVAVLDTAFHQTIPRENYLYAVPYSWYEKYQIRKYGFHGSSHLYVTKRAAVFLKKDPMKVNLITCHIGNGVSFTAIRNGLSYDHSMGFTPLEGLIMGTRSGDIDAAIIPYICSHEHNTSKKVEQILNRESGLKGITGKYSDRRDIHQAAQNGDERSQLALDMEAYRIRKYIGSYMAALGQVDALVFTAGAGEMAPFLREKAIAGLDNLGICLDLERNQEASHNHEFAISTDDSPVKILVIPTDEELVFVEDVVAILEDRYDIHTRFQYSFQDPEYVNEERREMYEKDQLAKKK